MKESTLVSNQHWLYLADISSSSETSSLEKEHLGYLRKNFCGKVTSHLSDLSGKNPSSTLYYLTGDMDAVWPAIKHLPLERLYIILELSDFTEMLPKEVNLITLGQVPINVHGVGVMFRNFFPPQDYFGLLNEEHKFQELSQGTKPGISYRKGIYLTPVTEDEKGKHFNLLRCSTNLRGPTDNFRKTDHQIVDQVNQMAPFFFHRPAPLNHVLGQIYQNQKVTLPSFTEDGKETEKVVERKARIPGHSDKTKDMPRNALMAFTTFYQSDKDKMKSYIHPEDDAFDWNYGKTSILTRLRFKKKPEVTDKELPEQFDVLLYPNSVFLTSLTGNRLYTHEIVPSSLPIDKLLTRLGYVIRCSNCPAVYRDGKTWIEDPEGDYPLVPSTTEKVKELKEAYMLENKTIALVDYGKVDFSMNEGDYLPPLV